MRWLLTLMLILLPGAVHADELRPSSIELSQQSETEWHLGWKQNIGQQTAKSLRVPKVPEVCEVTGEPVQRFGAQALIGSATVRCSGSLEGGQVGWSEMVGEDALLRVVPIEGASQAFRLTPDEPLATIAAAPDSWQVWQSYFPMGVEHILEGWDHLLFVIALVLLVAGGWAVVKAITAFTVAHSITLAAVSLGLFGLPAKPVEAAIALSIVFLAVELARGDRESFTRRWPWVVAFAFGLLHGFGFAGALREIGLPQGEIAHALVAFNLGVEAGQLMVIAGVVALRRALRRLIPKTEPHALKLATYGIGITASFWLIERVIT
ncbi:HupE/UreJ family protein [Altererythrobacter sp. MF3-039]|uniref:HupE/UreJ family protein n=1 Tax=Altererythrobacter sp. MF3-039 TaxID=3252901 RepID=UPI00390CB96C